MFVIHFLSLSSFTSVTPGLLTTEYATRFRISCLIVSDWTRGAWDSLVMIWDAEACRTKHRVAEGITNWLLICTDHAGTDTRWTKKPSEGLRMRNPFRIYVMNR